MEKFLRFVFECIWGPVAAILSYPVICIKWASDRAVLPLSEKHKELYFIIHFHMFKKLLRLPNIKKPVTFNDKIQWLKLFDQSEKMIDCSDKIKVRDYVKSKVGEEYLVENFQVSDSFEEIDYSKLPDSFVIKTNHDSGTVILVKDKADIDLNYFRKKINRSLNRVYGYRFGEWGYRDIKPKVLVEEFINPDSLTPPPDFKFYCVDGNVKFCHYIFDRGSKPKEIILDVEGNIINRRLHPKFLAGNEFEVPFSWGQMVKVAESVSSDFRCVRVDIFQFRDKIYVGEMTFWPMAGCYRNSKDEQKFFGALLDFDMSYVKEPVYKNRIGS